jgi:hypothetical protein
VTSGSVESTRRNHGANVGRAPANTFSHVRAFPDADFRAVVRPNFDTLYSSAWFDVSEEPQVVSMPDTAGRFYLLPMLDMWTDAFASPGWRTTGTGEQHWAIVPSGWSGELPDGVGRIEAPTTDGWLIGRIQTNGPDDYANVHAIQDQMRITPLSTWPGPAPQRTLELQPGADPDTEPMVQVERLDGVAFFTLAAELLQRFTPHATDFGMVERARWIGLHAGESFDASQLDAAQRAAIDAAPATGFALVRGAQSSFGAVRNGWLIATDSIGVYGNYYLKRAFVALIGLGANQPEDAIYPVQLADSEGEPAVGTRGYTLTFPGDDLPPVAAFWSVTLYDSDGFQVGNELDRFALGDRDPLERGTDGSITIHVAHECPADAARTNWLPAPAGPFSLTLRLYAPDPAALTGAWTPPVLERARVAASVG